MPNWAIRYILTRANRPIICANDLLCFNRLFNIAFLAVNTSIQFQSQITELRASEKPLFLFVIVRNFRS
ncbi:Immediate-early protein ICP-18 [Bienertia sinuspersici]